MAYCSNKFCQNILIIDNEFHSSTLSQGKSLVEESCISMMDTFEPFTETVIKQFLERSSNPSCKVDPMPTWLVKECQNVLNTLIRKIFNISISLGSFPKSTKLGLMKRLIIKKK